LLTKYSGLELPQAGLKSGFVTALAANYSNTNKHNQSCLEEGSLLVGRGK
jgi:hypothetical protein